MVGLGNPGRQYEATRHNVGFAVVDRLAARWGIPWQSSRFEALVAQHGSGPEKVFLAKPLTYMNRSGRAVAALCRYYRLRPEDQVLVICDDFQLPLGRLRFRPGGSAGGQKGLADVLLHLGTQNVPRLRVGVGPLPPEEDPARFVLARFAGQEREAAETMIRLAAEAAQDWLQHGIPYCMNRYNGLRPLEENNASKDADDHPDGASD